MWLNIPIDLALHLHMLVDLKLKLNILSVSTVGVAVRHNGVLQQTAKISTLSEDHKKLWFKKCCHCSIKMAVHAITTLLIIITTTKAHTSFIAACSLASRESASR